LISKPEIDPRLVVDLQTAQGGFFGDRGVRRYAMALTLALLRRDAVAAVLFNPNRPNVEPIPPELGDAVEAEWTSSLTLRSLDAEGITAYLMTSPFERARPVPALPRYVAKSSVPIVTVLYDLIPEIIEVHPPELMKAYRSRRELIKQLDLILTLSEHTKRDAIERLGMPPESVVTIGAGASDFFRAPLPGEQPRAQLATQVPAITKPFVFCVSGWLVHKNTEGLIDAWARLPRRIRDAHQLVVTCRLPPQAGNAWLERARELGFRENELVVTDYVDDDVLRALYQQARLFVLPSFYEGFGLPVLESARCGCPAISSNASAAPEVLQWPPATFSPGDIDEMASAIERGLCDEQYRSELLEVGEAAARRHTWERVADRVTSACAALPRRTTGHRFPRSRVALIGSFVPGGRIVVLSDHLADALRRHDVHVDLFDASPSKRDGMHCRSLTVLGRSVDAWSYDAIVYLVDEASPARLLDVARRYSGIVWFVAPPAACADAHEFASAARGRLIPPGTDPKSAAGLGPFARSTPTRVVGTDDPDSAIASLCDFLEALR